MVRCGWRGRLTAEGRARKGPLEAAHWGVTRGERRRAGPHLWEAQIEPWNTEGRRCTYSRSLAAAGIATWAEITNTYRYVTMVWLLWYLCVVHYI